jgi:phosphatidylinositol 4-phosphatase
LEESSRDCEQNAGFILTWLTWNQESRVASYSASAFPPTLTSASLRRSGLSNDSSAGKQSFAAFKVLPIEPRRETSEEYVGASSCREAVDAIVDRVYRACEDVGGGHGRFVTEEDVVRLVFLFFSYLFIAMTGIVWTKPGG